MADGDSEMTMKVVLLGGVGIAAYLLYKHYNAAEPTTVAPPPSGSSSATPPAQPAAGASAASTAQLTAQLLAASSSAASLTVDQWNYFLGHVSPSAGQLDGANFPNRTAGSGSAADYIAARASAGLSGAGGLGSYHYLSLVR